MFFHEKWFLHLVSLFSLNLLHLFYLHGTIFSPMETKLDRQLKILYKRSTCSACPHITGRLILVTHCIMGFARRGGQVAASFGLPASLLFVSKKKGHEMWACALHARPYACFVCEPLEGEACWASLGQCSIMG